MKFILWALCISVALSAEFGCGGTSAVAYRQPVKSNSLNADNLPIASSTSKEEAISIAKSDFLRIRGSLNDFVVEESELENGWRVVIRLKDKYLIGVGAVYLIDKKTGKILDKKFYQ